MAKQEGKGGLWHNKFKSQGDKRPDYVGEITIHGVTHKLSGWVSTMTHAGAPVINLVFNKEFKAPPKPNSYAPPPEVAKAVEFDPFDDKDKDIPF